MTLALIEDATLLHYSNIIKQRYASDDQFVHPDIGFLTKVLNGHSAFLMRGKAKAFAVKNHSTIIAFGVCFIDPALQLKMARTIGSIGFFEVTSESGTTVLLHACHAWLKTQGVSEIWAPFNGNPFYGMGFRENCFNEPAFVGCAHDSKHTRAYLETNNYDPMMRYCNFSIPLQEPLASPLKEPLATQSWLPYLKPIEGIRFRTMSRLYFRRDILHFARLHNEAFKAVWGEAEVSDEEALSLMMRSRFALQPKLFQFAMAGNKPVGFVMCMANLPEVLAPLHTPMTSLKGILKIIRKRKMVSAVGLLSLAVDPDYQGKGVGTALVARACDSAAALGHQQLEYALVVENNQASNAMAKKFGGKQCRSFAIYQYMLDTE